MRTRRPIEVAALAIALLILASTAASAHRHPSFGGGCRIDVNVAPHEITAGDPVVIFGRLVCRRPGREANQAVKLYHHLRGPFRGSFGFTYVQSTSTGAHGFYEFARADGVVDTNRSWFVRSRTVQSRRASVKVAAQVTLAGPPEGAQILTGVPNAVTFTGTVSPADVGARVVLQRQNAESGGDWRRIDDGRVAPGGSFSIVHAFRFPGDANVRVLVRSQRRNIPSTSNVLEYEISQAQNPRLTIGASLDPIAFGQSVTIGGVLAEGADHPVTLLARTARQRGFASVAQVDTDAGGNYSFPPQLPVNSTYYQVVSGDPTCALAPPSVKACKAKLVRSAVLYEGVRSVLSAQVSAVAVPAGQQLAFSGSIAPAHPGHVIYLERENASGNGFHVVQVGLVDAGSNYSIAHTVYDPGTKVFRVYIPGGPENLGAASQPFTIQVTPALPATLMPEAPGNSSLPAEGQS